MSKGKKTIEELLEEALVVGEEQPYEVPGNWVWVKIGLYLENHDGARIPISAKERGNIEGHTPYYGASGVIDYVDNWTHDGKYVLIGEDGANLLTRSKPISFIASGRFWVNNHAHVLKCINGTPEEYVSYYINSISLREYVTGSAQPKLTQKNLNNIPIPIPPLKEQKRIVEKVEQLLSKVEEAKRLIEEAKETFELRRAAILDKAFRGELTRKWRKTNINVEDAETLYGKIKESQSGKRKKSKEINVEELRHSIPSDWKWVRLGDVFTITSGGTPKRNISKFYNGNISWIKTGEIKWNYIYESEEQITSDAVADSSAKLLSKNSVLVAMYGQGLTRGRAAILGIEATCNQAVCALLPNDYILPEFLYYYFMEGYQRFRQVAKGGNQENLSATVISNFLFPLPPLEEQKVIVDILQSIFNKESMIKEIVEMKIDELKQSILSKAFRGELGTNDPNEEDAIELLKEVLQEQVK